MGSPHIPVSSQTVASPLATAAQVTTRSPESTIHDVPNEILAKIFHILLHTYLPHLQLLSQEMARIRLVCRRWDDIITGEAIFWKNIHLRGNPYLPFRHDCLLSAIQRFAKRARMAPLSFGFGPVFIANDWPKHFAKEIHRSHDISISLGHVESATEVLDICPFENAVNLEKFSLEVQTLGVSMLDIVSRLLITVPSLRHLAIGWIKDAEYHAPDSWDSAYRNVWANLTSLCLHGRRLEDVFSILQFATSVESLLIRTQPSRALGTNPIPTYYIESPLSFPNLRHLALIIPAEHNTILQAIEAPRLTVLSVDVLGTMRVPRYQQLNNVILEFLMGARHSLRALFIEQIEASQLLSFLQHPAVEPLDIVEVIFSHPAMIEKVIARLQEGFSSGVQPYRYEKYTGNSLVVGWGRNTLHGITHQLMPLSDRTRGLI
ncbi:hypothetical protein NP233_g11272 [Leucocoprinus birnbaumii]|uniref:F-box domain-containing protein n=1 Tax=Leucocoprinus birnbaumii TaxID=56174 RepID=A0AAD5VGU9_9AGAR|nr:hypothetical protein NP233_g11272 [Leucocoprinus birnbaumii]